MHGVALNREVVRRAEKYGIEFALSMIKMTNPVSMVNFTMGTLVGSYASVARMMDEMESIPGLKGALLTFDDFVEGMEMLGASHGGILERGAHGPA